LVILGIDPGIADTGYGVVRKQANRIEMVNCGCIRTPAGLPLSQRLQVLKRGLQAVLALSHPDVAALEQLFFARNARSAMEVGQARGVALLCLAEAGLSVHEYAPLAVKSALTGYGRAEKPQMLRMVRAALGRHDLVAPDDAIDALAVAICHLHGEKLRAATNGARVG
jgi:crossover junction endodeoxyribonuclease RuvC